MLAFTKGIGCIAYVTLYQILLSAFKNHEYKGLGIFDLIYCLLLYGHVLSFTCVILWHHVATMAFLKEILAHSTIYLSTLVFRVHLLVDRCCAFPASVDRFACRISFSCNALVVIKTVLTSEISIAVLAFNPWFVTRVMHFSTVVAHTVACMSFLMIIAFVALSAKLVPA